MVKSLKFTLIKAKKGERDPVVDLFFRNSKLE